MIKVYQIWYETDVGPIFTSKEKAIAYINKDCEEYGDDPYDPKDDYPDIREFEVDTGFIEQKGKFKRVSYDR